MLPDPIANWAFDVAEIVGCDPIMPAMMGVSVCAAALHDAVKIQPKALDTTWTESSRLWLCIVGDSSSKKSAAMDHAMNPLKKIDARCNEQEKQLRYKLTLDEQAFKTKEKTYIDKMGKGEPAELPIKPELPEIPRAIAQDCTIESIGKILRYCDRGILSSNDELARWFGAHDAYKNARGLDRATWLEAYNGGSRRIDRVAEGGSGYIRNWSVSVIGGIQPEVLSEIADSQVDSGMMQRFMFAYASGGVEGPDRQHNRAYTEAYHHIVNHLWNVAPSHQHVILSNEAQDIRQRINAYANKFIVLKFISPGFCSAMGKISGMAARIMLTYHAVECASRSVHPESVQVSADTALRVERLISGLVIKHMIIFYSNAGTGSVTAKKVKSVAGLILAHNLNSVSKRYIHQHNDQWRRWKDNERETVLRQLMDAGWLYPMEAKRGVDKFPTNFLVNPSLPVMFDKHKLAEVERREQWAAIYRDMRDGK